MGRVVASAIAAAGDLELVAEIGRGDDVRGRTVAARAQVVVEFTAPDQVAGNVRAILGCGASPVIGTTGMKAEDLDSISRECAQLRRGGILAPNFAIGAILMMRFAAIAARHLAAAEIVEAHHAGKRDAPSGTALATAAAVSAAAGKPRDAIPIHSVRLPGILAEQSVVFGDLGQKLVIEHVSYGRDAYVPGVLLACRRVLGLDKLVIGLDRIVFGEADGQPS
jgi:4-hydroxy-tetrahydrodipicolinate reductase